METVGNLKLKVVQVLWVTWSEGENYVIIYKLFPFRLLKLYYTEFGCFNQRNFTWDIMNRIFEIGKFIINFI